jgi:Pyruvate/2-oxoacid:ferredoxin oxidoreductase delta subunit
MKHIYICACHNHRKIDQATVESFIKQLEKKNIAYTYLEDLCGTALEGKEEIQDLLEKDHVEIYGCHPHAMQHLLENAGRKKQGISYHHVDETKEEDFQLEENIEKGKPLQVKYEGEWKPWYPVIDYDKCNGCRKCLNFCLFSVYSVEEDGTVVVSASANCKDMCPACARVCPQNAIIFPKHPESPIDGGEADGNVMPQTNLLDQIQNDDVYSVLAARRSNFKTSLLKKDKMKLAEEERKACSCNKK